MGKSKDLATLKSGLSIDGTLTTTSTGTNLTSNSYNVVKIQTDKDDNGSNDDAILQFTTGSSNTVKGELRYDESETMFEIGHGDNQGHIRIDSSGRVTKPSQPAFKAYLASTQDNVTGSSAIQSSSYAWTSIFNIGNHFSSGTFTAPVSGTYLFTGHWSANGNSMGDASYHTFRVNNSSTNNYASSGLSMFDPRSMEWDQIRVNYGGSSILFLSANDTVVMYGGNLDSGSNDVDLVGGNSWHTTMFSGYLLA